ncbi:unnamed protein product [Porites lobata]|uniref:RRM domain-containing protein n=1 Tax=Porites lobata TaxID=104759 RepID=A0ABN8NKI8_9CNID|nr:unnamed protein product [Porites lobata]
MAYALKPDDFASRKVIVKNLSPITKQEDIIIHFQRRGNGGGEVDSVHMLNERAAVVTFEESTVAESVLKRQHEIHGSLVTVELYRPLPDQVFGRVSGRIDPNTLNASNHSMKTILQQIQDETKVVWYLRST